MTPVPSPPPPRGRPHIQRFILRFSALVSAVALPAVICPPFAAEKLSWLLGFGQPPKAPLLFYFTGGGSAVYVAVAGMLWIISRDVVRYRPLVIFVAWVYLACGPIFLSIDSQSGMPLWWIAMDSLGSLAAGAALLWACYSPKVVQLGPN